MADKQGKRLLSLDGGGIRALSALVIAKIQMEKLQCQLKLSETPRPCDWYDLIAGSGTGGLLAIMLGRLRMSIDDAIKWYLVIVEEVFSKKKWVGGVGALRASKLEDVLGRMALEYTGDARARMLESNPMQGKCKTFVCAMSAYNMNALIPTLLRSYNIGDNQGPDCTIVEAARATTACAGLFKPVFILQDGVMVPYVDSGLGRNNPTAPMLVEAERLFPGTHVACIVSIGTGHPETISMPVRTDVFQRFLSPDMVQTLKSIASDCEATAHEMARRFQHVDGVYFRFSVDQGMQSIGLSDWEKISEVVVHTRQYAQAIEVTSHLNRAVVAIKSGKAMVPVEQLSGYVRASGASIENTSPTFKKRSGAVRCPPPSRAFTGRVDIINHMRAYFSTDCQTQRLFVLHGLGGAGKTQLALSFIHRHKHFFSDIFYVDATSRDTIAAGLKELAIYVEAGDTQQHALKWLASQEDQWMLLYNNADNPEINLHEYFPICAHGNILITTRNQQMIAHTRGSGAECLVSSMLPDDAERLLLKTSGVQDSQEAKETAAILTKHFGYLALAIVQAGTYIYTMQCGLDGYLKLYILHRERLLAERQIGQTDDYELTVCATWGVSYQQLSSSAAHLLNLMAFMHHDNIREDIFQKASDSVGSFKPNLPLTAAETANKSLVLDFLSSFRASQDTWDPMSWLKLIVELRSYSLLDFDPDSKSYSVHPLVHSWCRITVPQATTIRDCVTWILALSVNGAKSNSQADYAFRRRLMPHLDALQKGGAHVSPTLALEFIGVYEQEDRWKELEELLTEAREASKQTLGTERLDTLVNTHNLAFTFLNQNRLPEAEPLLLEVTDAFQQLLGKEHPGTLRANQNLAKLYLKQGKTKAAQDLFKETLEVKTRVLGKEDHSTLITMGSLGLTYFQQGRFSDAEALYKEAMDISSRTMGPRHPSTLTAISYLAKTYGSQKKWDEAERLMIQLIEGQKEEFGEEDSRTQTNISYLAQLRRDMADTRLL